MAAPDALGAPRRPGRIETATAVQLAVSLVALGAVVWWALRQDAPNLPRSREDVLALLAAVAIYALATLARAERWHRIVARAGVAAGRGETYRLTTVGYMGNNVLPARSGDLLRAFLLAPRAGTRKRNVLGTVVAERLLDVVALALVFGVVAYGVLPDLRIPGGTTTVAVVVVAAGAAILGGAVALALARRRGALARVRALVRPLAAPTRALASGHGLALLALSLVLWTLEAAVYLAVGRAAGVELGLLDALYVVALTNLFALIPAAPGYVGTFDAGILVGLSATGVVGGDAVGVLLLARFVWFVPVTLVGLGVLLLGYGGLRRPAADDEELLPEEPPRERRREVASGQRGAGG
jgi:glycosyltransferase 2 family protein